MMKKIKIMLMFTLVASLVISACQPAPPVDTPLVEDDYAYGQNAIVEDLDVLLMESFPLQARAVVKGYLRDGCTELYEIEVERDGVEFMITLTTRRPTGDVACTEALVPFEESVNLEIEGLVAGIYTVTAQEQRAQFTLDVDNVLQSEGGEDILLTSDAVLEDLAVMILESDPVQVRVSLSGYLPDGCTTIHEIRSSRDGDVFTIQIVTERPAGDVACTMAIVPFEEELPLDVAGLPAGAYTLRVDGMSETFVIDADN